MPRPRYGEPLGGVIDVVELDDDVRERLKSDGDDLDLTAPRLGQLLGLRALALLDGHDRAWDGFELGDGGP